MSAIELKVTKRATGKTEAKAIRSSGMVPGVYYANGQESTPISADPIDLRPIIFTPQTKVVELDIEGEIHRSVVKEIDFNPITDEITHIDFLGLTEGNPITVSVPLKMVGSSVGVKNGGILSQVIRKVKLTCLPEDLVEFIEVDVSSLDIGDVINLDTVRNDKLTFAIKTNPVIAQVLRPRVKKAAGTAE